MVSSLLQGIPNLYSPLKSRTILQYAFPLKSLATSRSSSIHLQTLAHVTQVYERAVRVRHRDIKHYTTISEMNVCASKSLSFREYTMPPRKAYDYLKI